VGLGISLEGVSERIGSLSALFTQVGYVLVAGISCTHFSGVKIHL
jgi:hypothetical protein